MKTSATTYPTQARVAGALLILLAALFLAVFTLLAISFGYPDVLDRPAAEVLPRLLAGGTSLRLTWLVYALIPLLILPATALLARGNSLPDRLLKLSGTAAMLTLSLGLVRWPSLNWVLAQQFSTAGPDTQAAISAIVAGTNTLLGTFIGEFLGELFLYTWLLAGLLLLISKVKNHWLVLPGWATVVLGYIGAFRAVTPLVQWATDLNNLFLPLWLIVWGILVIRNTYKQA